MDEVWSFNNGKQRNVTGREFVADLANRLTDRVQLTSDGWHVYRDVVTRAFNLHVDYAMLTKECAANRDTAAPYSPPVCIALARSR